MLSSTRSDRFKMHERRGRSGLLADIFGDAHRAEFWAAHAAERRGLEGVLRQRLVVHSASGLGVERQPELFFPVKLISRARQGVVAVACPGTVPREIGGGGGG